MVRQDSKSKVLRPYALHMYFFHTLLFSPRSQYWGYHNLIGFGTWSSNILAKYFWTYEYICKNKSSPVNRSWTWCCICSPWSPYVCSEQCTYCNRVNIFEITIKTISICHSCQQRIEMGLEEFIFQKTTFHFTRWILNNPIFA